MGRGVNSGLRLAQSLEELGLVNRDGRHLEGNCLGVCAVISKKANGMRVNHRPVSRPLALGGTQQSRDLA